MQRRDLNIIEWAVIALGYLAVRAWVDNMYGEKLGLFAGAAFAFASSLYNLYIERSKTAGVFVLVLLGFALFACPYW